ncbi:hypothetical protein GIB67_025738, partial [Kingdonia uniflora]
FGFMPIVLMKLYTSVPTWNNPREAVNDSLSPGLVFEVAPSLHVVELRKTGGDTLEFNNFYKSFSSELKDIVWKSEGNSKEMSDHRDCKGKSDSLLVAILPLAIVHTMGNLFTNISLGKVVVSFTHTIKAMKSFFSILLSAMFLGDMLAFWIVSCLVPIVGGLALASIFEASFNW